MICIVASIGAIPLGAGRAAASDPVWMWSLFASVLYGTTIILAQPQPEVHLVWNHVSGRDEPGLEKFDYACQEQLVGQVKIGR